MCGLDWLYNTLWCSIFICLFFNYHFKDTYTHSALPQPFLGWVEFLETVHQVVGLQQTKALIDAFPLLNSAQLNRVVNFCSPYWQDFDIPLHLSTDLNTLDLIKSVNFNYMRLIESLYLITLGLCTLENPRAYHLIKGPNNWVDNKLLTHNSNKR